jgi:hypothetical protein
MIIKKFLKWGLRIAKSKIKEILYLIEFNVETIKRLKSDWEKDFIEFYD